MFPLGAVLFPHVPLPLRVFEDRYLVMLAQVLEHRDREFGVVLIERGSEVGGGDGRFRIGTMARVEQLVRGDDHLRLLARGGRRFEVVEWLDDDPYPRAVVQDLPELTWDDAFAPHRAAAEHVVRRVLARAAEFRASTWDADIALSSDPVAACWQLAAIAPLGPLDQIELLRATDAPGLLARVTELTEAAEPLLTTAEPDTEFDDALDRLLGGDDGPDADGYGRRDGPPDDARPPRG